jgi:hypothetical protein
MPRLSCNLAYSSLTTHRRTAVCQVRAEVPDVDIQITHDNLGYCGGNNSALRQGLSEGYDYGSSATTTSSGARRHSPIGRTPSGRPVRG